MAVRRRPTMPCPAPPPPGWRPSAEARRAALRTLADGHLSDGDGLGQRTFEATVARLVDLEPDQVRAFASGSAAVLAALLCAGARPGRRVLVSALAPAYVAGVVALTGATPVPVDVDSGHLGLAAAFAAGLVGRGTAAVLWTPPLAAGATLDELRCALGSAGPELIEDAAHLLGERDHQGHSVGARAFAGAFSLSYGKALGAGEGGLLTAPTAAAAEALGRLDGSPAARGMRPLPRLAALGRLARLTSAVATASLGELAERRTRRRALSARLAAVAAAADVASFGTAGLPLWAGRFGTAAAAWRAQARAESLRMDLLAPALWSGRRQGLAVARDSVERVRILSWWDAGAARPAEVETLVNAFACALGAEA